MTQFLDTPARCEDNYCHLSRKADRSQCEYGKYHDSKAAYNVCQAYPLHSFDRLYIIIDD